MCSQVIKKLPASKEPSRKVQYVLLQNNSSGLKISTENITRIPFKAEQSKWATGTQSVHSRYSTKINAAASCSEQQQLEAGIWQPDARYNIDRASNQRSHALSHSLCHSGRIQLFTTMLLQHV